MKISVICPVYNEEKYIEDCINSLLTQDFSWDESEIFFIDGMSTDNTRDIITNIAQDYKFIYLLDNPKRITPAALNIGIKKSKNYIVFRIDAHTKYPSNYFSILSDYLIKLKADNVGGVCRTLPGGKGIIPSSIAKAMTSFFGMGTSLFRIGTTKIKEVDTVPFGCFNRDIFKKLGYFDEQMIRNQDDEFNGRIIKNGGKIFLIPQVVIDYFARKEIRKMSLMFYQYGLYKPLIIKKLGRPVTIRQFFPLFFILWIFIGCLLSLIYNGIFLLYFSILIIYLLLAFFFSLKLSSDFLQFLFIPVIFFIIHISYGFGYFVGILKILI